MQFDVFWEPDNFSDCVVPESINPPLPPPPQPIPLSERIYALETPHPGISVIFQLDWLIDWWMDGWMDGLSTLWKECWFKILLHYIIMRKIIFSTIKWEKNLLIHDNTLLALS